jgi:hypothetical protein
MRVGDRRSHVEKVTMQPIRSEPVPETPGQRPQGMVPARARRGTTVERASMRVIATAGIVGIATAVGAVVDSQDVAGWITALVASAISVILAAVLWSSRQL